MESVEATIIRLQIIILGLALQRRILKETKRRIVATEEDHPRYYNNYLKLRCRDLIHRILIVQKEEQNYTLRIYQERLQKIKLNKKYLSKILLKS